MYRPKNKEELFNLRHASLRNVIERIFGILKSQFCILEVGCEYPMEFQARVVPALCAIHNFIRIHDPAEISDFAVEVEAVNVNVVQDYTGVLREGPANRQEQRRANKRWDDIAQAMWDHYIHVMNARGEPVGN